MIGPSRGQELRSQRAIRHYGALLLSVGQVQTEPTRRGSRWPLVEEPNQLVLYWPSMQICARVYLVGGRHWCARR